MWRHGTRDDRLGLLTDCGSAGNGSPGNTLTQELFSLGPREEAVSKSFLSVTHCPKKQFTGRGRNKRMGKGAWNL